MPLIRVEDFVKLGLLDAAAAPTMSRIRQHNSLLFDRPQKSVVRAPFYPFPRGISHGQPALLPKPPWFITNKRAHEVTRKLTYFEGNPNPLRLPGIFFSALRG